MNERYDKILLARHPKNFDMKQIAEADLVLLSYSHGGRWHVVKDRYGKYPTGEVMADELKTLLA